VNHLRQDSHTSGTSIRTQLNSSASVATCSLVSGWRILCSWSWSGEHILDLHVAVAPQVSNQALADEKTRTDVLLARQYNLISLMAQQGMFGGGSSCGASALHEKTLGTRHAAAAAAAAVADYV
jgi:hypothetical protein